MDEDEKKYKCRFCDECFDSSVQLEEHWKTHRRAEPSPIDNWDGAVVGRWPEGSIDMEKGGHGH